MSPQASSKPSSTGLTVTASLSAHLLRPKPFSDRPRRPVKAPSPTSTGSRCCYRSERLRQKPTSTGLGIRTGARALLYARPKALLPGSPRRRSGAECGLAPRPKKPAPLGLASQPNPTGPPNAAGRLELGARRPQRPPAWLGPPPPAPPPPPPPAPPPPNPPEVLTWEKIRTR
ncbi:hypothetical protein chiPu_0028460 [Chiloscyllium punctatum]|uniref:Uncharacterized protein n=1 Tax=Chiloscyllium punctatum TaxID=137246 RepID=A0A401TPF4_CHIPU|nr:hypothetical protein [Chiloscyllium punctatum]